MTGFSLMIILFKEINLFAIHASVNFVKPVPCTQNSIMPIISVEWHPTNLSPQEKSVANTNTSLTNPTAQKMRFSIKDFFSKCDQIRRFLWIWSHVLKKSLLENFIFCAVSWRQPTKFFLQISHENGLKHGFQDTLTERH